MKAIAIREFGAPAVLVPAERPQPVPGAGEALIRVSASGINRPDVRFTPEAMAKLTAHGWPGNVRELENVVRRAAIFAAGPTIGPDDLELDDGRARSAGGAGLVPDLDVPLGEAKDALIHDFEKAYIEAALLAAGGNVSRAARRAGRERKSFHDLVQRYGIEVDRMRGE